MAKHATIVILAVGLVVRSASSPAATCDPADFTPGAARFTHGPIASAVRGLSARIGFRTDTEACVQIKYATDPGLVEALISDAVLTEADHDFSGNIRLQGLAPHTTYYYTIVVNGVDTDFAVLPRFKTFPRPRDPVSFTFGVLTDLIKSQPAPALGQLAKDEPAFVVILGDYHHGNPTTLAEMRTMHRQVREEAVSGPDLRDNILRQFPVAHIWDDHDFGTDDSDKTFPAKADALKAFDEYWPTYERPNPGKGIWHKFNYGSLAEIYMLDLRYQRDPRRDPDDTSKSMLDGDMIPNGQKEWLKSSLLASKATWKFIASTVPWNPSVPKQDAWHGFRTEQQELVDFIRAEGITGVIFFSGDIHLGGAIDDGSTAYFAEMNVPTTNMTNDNVTCGGSDLCGDWSEGWDPGGGGYGLVTVSPNSVLLRAKDETGGDRFSLTIPTGSVYVAPFVCGEKNTAPGSSAVPGWYATTINIGNPHPDVALCGNKYFVVANPQSEARGPASARVLERLDPAEAVGVTCEDIRQAFDPPLSGFIQGSLLLELIPDPGAAGSKPPALSVVGVYSAKKRTLDDATEPQPWDEESVNPVGFRGVDVTFTSVVPTFPCPEE